MKSLIKKTYKKFEYLIKYTLSAGISFFIDLSFFTLFTFLYKKIDLLYYIVFATISARIISSFINYYLNKNKVFNHGKEKSVDKRSLILFYSLTIVQMLVSSFAVSTIFDLTHFNETLIKIPVECVIFVVNFLVQKFFIFKNK